MADISRATPSGWLDTSGYSATTSRATPSGWVDFEAAATTAILVFIAYYRMRWA